MKFHNTVKPQFNESRFNVKSQFKVQNLVTKIEFLIKKSRFSVKSRFKVSKCADRGHSLNRDFTVMNLEVNIFLDMTKSEVMTFKCRIQ